MNRTGIYVTLLFRQRINVQNVSMVFIAAFITKLPNVFNSTNCVPGTRKYRVNSKFVFVYISFGRFNDYFLNVD